MDTFGETKKFHKIAKSVFLGGSVVKRGGQNPLEAARFGSRIIHGPNTQNFTDIYKLLRSFNISRKITTPEQLASSIIFKKNKKIGIKLRNIGKKVLNDTIKELDNQINNEFKKPKFWDYKHRNLLAYLLYPVSILIKIISQFKFHPKNEVLKIKTICVGNIYVGGTGKTSLCMKINKILKQKNIKSCFVKKYYKNQIDEQEILKKNGTLFLSKKRLDAVKLAEKENYEFAIFDDGLQDNSINYDASFVCFNNLNWIGNGMTIPSGPLRENLENLKNINICF